MSKASSLKANFGYNFIYNILNIIVPLITAPYISRVLGADNIGVYSFTSSILSTVLMIGALGSATYGQKEMATVQKDPQARTQVFWEIFVIRATTTAVAILCFVPMALVSEQLLIYLLQVPYLVAAIFDISWFFQGIEQFKYITLRNSLVKIVSVIFTFLFVKDQNDLPIYLLILGISQLGGNLSMWPYLKGNIKKGQYRITRIKKHLSGMLVYFIPSIAYQIYAVLDKAMLGMIANAYDENGYYEQAYRIINMVITVITAYTVVMRSRMSLLFAEKQTEEIKQKMTKSSEVIAFLVFPMSFGLAAVAAGMVPWFFGDGYDKVTTLLYVFSPIFIFMGYSHLIGTHLLTPSGRQVKSNIAQIVAAASNVILNAILIPMFYSVGAAIASVIAEIVIVILYFWFVRHEYSLVVALKTGWKKCVSAAIMGVAVFMLSRQFEVSILNSFIEVAIGAMMYIVILLMLKDDFTIDAAKGIIGKIWNKIRGSRQ